MTKQELYDAIPEFVDRHWPKNDTAAHGGAPTPGRGEVAVLLTRFVTEAVPDDPSASRLQGWRFHASDSGKTGPCQRRFCMMCLVHRSLSALGR